MNKIKEFTEEMPIRLEEKCCEVKHNSVDYYNVITANYDEIVDFIEEEKSIILKAVIEEIEDQFEVYKNTGKVKDECDSERNETLKDIINLIKESIK